MRSFIIAAVAGLAFAGAANAQAAPPQGGAIHGRQHSPVTVAQHCARHKRLCGMVCWPKRLACPHPPPPRCGPGPTGLC
jgi:hypothetical protein